MSTISASVFSATLLTLAWRVLIPLLSFLVVFQSMAFAADPSLTSCDCKWPNPQLPGFCDAPPKLCSYCTDALAYMYYGPENSPSVGCLVTGRNQDVCVRIAGEVEVSYSVGNSLYHLPLPWYHSELLLHYCPLLLFRKISSGGRTLTMNCVSRTNLRVPFDVMFLVYPFK